MKTKKLIPILLTFTIFATGLSGCGGSRTVEEEILPYPVTVKGATIEQAPRAIASLSPTITEVLVDLGYHSKIVGYSDEYVLPEPPVVEEPVVEKKKFRWFWEKKEEIKEPEPELPKGEIGTALFPDLEKIGEYMPEIVFTTIPMTKANLDKLSGVNIKVIVLPVATSFEEIKANYLEIIKAVEGQVVTNEKGTQLVADAQYDLEFIMSMVPKDKKSFLYLAGTTPIIATGDTFEHDVLSILGENLAATALDYTVLMEELELMDPDIIFYSKTVGRDFLNESELFSGKTAVVNDTVIELDPALFTNQTLGIVENIRKLASTLYPEVDFTKPVIVEEEDGASSKDDIAISKTSSKESSSEGSSSEESSSVESSSEGSSSEEVSN